MIEYSNNTYLERDFISGLRKAYPAFHGNGFRLWSLDFMFRNIDKSESTLDVICGKNQAGCYLYNKGYNIRGVDGGISNFTRADKRGEKNIIYKDFPIRIAKVPPIPFDDNEFDCVTMINVWRWLHPLQTKAGVDYNKYNKHDANICQKQYTKILMEVCRIASKRIVIVERIHIRPNAFSCDLLESFGIIEDGGFFIEGANNFTAPDIKELLLIDTVKKTSDGNKRTTYYGIGIVAHRKEGR